MLSGGGLIMTAQGQQSSTDAKFDFESETVGDQPKSIVPIVGNFTIGNEGDNKVLVIDGRKWQQGQTATGVAERAKTLYGDRYGEFLDNVKAFAYFPYAVATGIDDFRDGEISLRFKGIAGVDQGAGVLFNLKTNGDYRPSGQSAREQSRAMKFGRQTQLNKWVRTRHAEDLARPQGRDWGQCRRGVSERQAPLTHELAQPSPGRWACGRRPIATCTSTTIT
jgi:hypothetical protein